MSMLTLEGTDPAADAVADRIALACAGVVGPAWQRALLGRQPQEEATLFTC